jgi:hypothetical protein
MQRNDHSCWPLFGRDDVSALGVGAAGVRLNPVLQFNLIPWVLLVVGVWLFAAPVNKNSP